MLMKFHWWPASGRNSGASRTDPKPQLTDEQWFRIQDLFPWDPPSRSGGRPRVQPRACLEGILWILRTGARWQDLPKCFPSPATCWRRLHEWTASGVFQLAWQRCLRQLDDLGQLDLEEALADGSFSRAKKGVRKSA
jgi:transposase